jgi:hypothetical protein
MMMMMVMMIIIIIIKGNKNPQHAFLRRESKAVSPVS